VSRRWVYFFLLPLLCGCQALPLSVSEVFLGEQGRSIVLVLDRSSRPAGVGVVARATYGEVFVALTTSARDLPAEPLLALSDHAVPALVRAGRGVVVLEARRAGRDLRAAVPGPPPLPGATVILLTAERGPWIDLWTSEALESDANEILLGRPQLSAEDGVTPPLGALQGAPAFSMSGNLIGFVLGVDDAERLVVGPADRLALRMLEACGLEGGAEVLGPDDGERSFQVQVSSVADLPAIDDGWGAPDFDVLLEVAGRAQDRLRLERGRVEVTAPAAGPVVARLVERDVGLFDGDVAEDVAHAVRLEALSRTTRMEFDLLGRLHERYRDVAPGVRPRVELRVEPNEPDRASGTDCALLGARPVPLRRAVRGELDREAGDATDLWTLDLDQPTEVWCALLRPAAAVLAVEAFGPRLGETALRWPEDDGTVASLPPPQTGSEAGRLTDRPPLVSVGPRSALRPQAGTRLSIGRASLPAGRCVLRVRALRGGGLRYGLIVVSQDDPEGLVRALFRLISRESQLGWPALQEPAFVREVAQALSHGAGLKAADALSAVLAELGHRTPAVRRLALGLLETHYPPALLALDRVVRTGAGPRARDAELLLALRRPGDSSYAGLVRRASGDPDPRIRLRALVVASRIGDEELRQSLLGLFEADPSPLVRRALARARG
jgi:hypothetical protein